MTQDQIIEMARQAGGLEFITRNNIKLWAKTNQTDFLERFAKLVAEAEHKKCEDVAMKVVEEAIDIAMFLEREACAKACENIMNDLKNWPSAFEGVTAETKFIHRIGETIAQPFIEAIRARGQA